MIRTFLLNRVLAWPVFSQRARRLGMLALGMDVAGAMIEPRCTFLGTDISIGPGTGMNYLSSFDTTAHISIGALCDVGFRSTFITRDDTVPAGGRPITVGDRTWFGANVTVWPGVTIGEGCIIAAGSVVTEDCAPHGMYAGVPARRLRDLPTAPQPTPLAA